VRRTIRTMDDVLLMLDGMFMRDDSGWWDGFYSDRGKPVPFFVPKPDENLASYLARGLLAPGCALDLGCGPGRNAVYLAASGFEVDAVDLSPVAVAWARERAREAGVQVRFHRGDIFSAGLPPGRYDLVYDSGCLHHLPPHRRVSYRDLLDRVLAPGGYFGLACFACGAMGSELPDEEFYRHGRMFGGMAFSPEELRWIFPDLTEVEIRPMAEQAPDSPLFGVPFLLTALFRRPEAR
jgi:SAM-dependent methyltransferase